MFEKGPKVKVFSFLRYIFLYFFISIASFCQARELTKAIDVLEELWDPNRYISVEEIQPGMEAYCLTAFKGTEVEKFSLEVLSVVYNISPGRDAILVQGTDERFIHTGPVGGCSGSPVYIEGRLAGALAFGWTFSKDPLYGVTPIKEMLSSGQIRSSANSYEQKGFVFDFSKPIDFAHVYDQITRPVASRRSSIAGASFLPCPLVTSGLPADVTEEFGSLMEPFGLMVVSGVGGGLRGSRSPQALKAKSSGGAKKDTGQVRLEPGACLAIPLITGDVEAEVVGTVTEVVGDKVYGFGHGFLEYGAVDLPIATGQVHTVVSNVLRSFKFATALDIVGALRTDEMAAVVGQLGAKAKMIPMTVRVERFNDPQTRVFNCQIANNRLYTPIIVNYVVGGTAYYLGDLPPDNTVVYKATIGLEDAEPISFENISTGLGLREMLTESVSSIALLLNNPFRKVDVESLDFEVSIADDDISSGIWSVDLSDSEVKAGDQINIAVVLESYLAEKKKYDFTLRIPEQLQPGRYELMVCGGYDYEKFLRKAAQYKYIAYSLKTLVEAMNSILEIERDRLYCILVLPPRGVAVERAELPDLPATKAMVMADAKRTLRVQPYNRWLEDSLKTDTVVFGRKVMRITVEK